MQLKLRFKFLIAIILTLGLFYTGCIDEPAIDPIARPYTMLRVANFVNNINQLKVEIFSDSTTVERTFSGLNQYELSGDFFKVMSGGKRVRVSDGSGKVLFDKEVSISSYQRLNLFFTGTYIDTLENKGTFGPFTFSEGEVYQSSTPKPDSIHIFFVNAARDSVNDAAKTLTPIVTFNRTPTQKKDSVLSSLGYGRVRSMINTVKGNYYVRFFSSPDTLMKSNFTLSDAGKRYFMIVYGAPSKSRLLLKSFDPLPVMSK